MTPHWPSNEYEASVILTFSDAKARLYRAEQLTSQRVLQRHPFFDGMDWEHLYSTQPPYRPSVAHELDTQVCHAD